MTPLKRHRFIPFLLLFACLMLSLSSGAQRRRRNPASGRDTLNVDTTQVDTLSVDTVAPKKKQPLDAPVVYEANDSIVFTEGGYAHLYGDGKVNYEKIELTSAVITMNMDSSTVYARGVPDSVGVETGTPIFKDGETPYESKIMRYNFKTKKGFINNIVTQQGEGYVTSEESKKGAGDELYLRHGRYTTCDQHDHPHFYLKLSMAKVRPKKNVVFGPAQLVVEDVPLPIAVPFGFFPFNSSYSSGFIMPTYGDEMNRGFYLRDGGYYFAISDRMDLKLLGEIFTKGSWGLSAQSNYNKRYKYSGNFNASYLVTKTGEKNMPDYSVTKDFKLSWSHRQDAKASPNSSFSANVNFATSSYDRRSISSLYDPMLIFASFCTIGMYILQIQSLEKISAFTVNLTYNLEPIYSIILAMILFGEAKDLGLSFYIGLAFIALSVGLQTWSVMRIQKRVAALDKLAAEDSDKKPHPVFIEPIGSRKERE